jgi:imidazolonepropionase-like amidohydrolase
MSCLLFYLLATIFYLLLNIYTMFKHYILLATMFLAAPLVSAQQVPPPVAKAQTAPIVIRGGTIHLGNGQVIENAEIRFEKGKIVSVGPAGTSQGDAELINATGKHIYPGLILANTPLGISEVDQVRQANDNYEVGDLNPHVRSLIAYNTDSEIVPTNRSNGITMAQITPAGGIFSGLSSVVQLDAWNWEDAAYKTDEGLHLNWPALYQQSGWWAEPGAINKNEKRQETIDQIEKFLQEALAYSQVTLRDHTNLKLEAAKGLFDGSRTLFIHTDQAKGIIEAVQMAKRFGVKKIVAVEAAEAWTITEFLKENNVGVILDKLARLPSRQDEDVDLPFRIPSILQKAGVTFALSYADPVSSSRNLPFMAGIAAAYGLSKEEALMSITSSAAKLLGIDQTVGTLENGKDATLVISEGDILDMKTSVVNQMFIQGRKIDLNNKHTEQYKRFKNKYDGK